MPIFLTVTLKTEVPGCHPGLPSSVNELMDASAQVPAGHTLCLWQVCLSFPKRVPRSLGFTPSVHSKPLLTLQSEAALGERWGECDARVCTQGVGSVGRWGVVLTGGARTLRPALLSPAGD